MRKPRIAAYAAAAALAFGAAACGGGSSGGTGAHSSAAYNVGLAGTVNKSSATGHGTLRLEQSSDLQSTDPGNSYFGADWDVMRLYTRSLVTFAEAPGPVKLVPDLATDLGTMSADGLTWTFHLVKGATYTDGSPITAQDVAYGIERSNWGQEVLPNGPTYFKQLLTDTTNYQGPYKDKNPADHPSGIDTPDSDTIVFHLVKPFADFDDVLTLPSTVPVPRAKDTGATYYEHVLSSGAYRFDSYAVGKELDLSASPAFNAASDPLHLHVAHAARIVDKVDVSAQTVDQDLLHGTTDVDQSGAGVQTATQSQVLGNPRLKAEADDPITGLLTYLTINTTIKPFDDIDCRKAVEWAIDKSAVQTAFGGGIGGGDIATTVLPPTVPGYVQQDLYQSPGHTGDLAKARAEIATCKAAEHVTDITTQVGYYIDQPKDKPVADVVQQNLAAIGITVTEDGFKYSQLSIKAGSQSYVKQNNEALFITAWAADFPSGYGFLDQILTPDGIKATGESNYSELDDPAVDSLMATALKTTDPDARNALYAQIDQQALKDAALVPMIDSRALMLRPPNLTNAYIEQAYGMYDYQALGVQ
ncbi:ABC transporter substrate-binding protein [Catenulispora sp. NF23]|uniref:ABC transporter substrate-binding protein n=1 Tax=Catenulispora pinistramenti TaxID=2705254 RepID=UPI001BADB5F0|nr:ABC transporter substrate-binding protein [Catenulispora pinistramenti]MBS2533895.1 ABC transporter substrate-binding protein [Catenulispora pinistramenti]